MATLIKRIISAPMAPAAMGPYSQAVLIDRTMYIAGQLGMDPSSGQLVPGGAKEEAKQALKNIGEILKAAGCDYCNGECLHNNSRDVQVFYLEKKTVTFLRESFVEYTIGAYSCDTKENMNLDPRILKWKKTTQYTWGNPGRDFYLRGVYTRLSLPQISD
ncbi:ceroid-lipofuscinosis neuronal protein 6 [Platysternon megacephalum]|uniref:Ceroid-lipofuscinosis neuronal protein 6 n=1 Tax=Platysternon megacephalum TaxID=55544 RepID=A0A4D9E563_9SAUR|nr:ceroid-lipofuscinosis neuronal protein 6 [Platysternon megacephalum]